MVGFYGEGKKKKKKKKKKNFPRWTEIWPRSVAAGGGAVSAVFGEYSKYIYIRYIPIIRFVSLLKKKKPKCAAESGHGN
jgi:hypothetical protein